MKKILFFLSIVLIFASCKHKQTQKMTDVNISKSVIYEVNIRQYTPEGTFKAFEKHLQRLKDLGVDILWFMPVQPIGEKNRKGTLGSYYSIKNYTEVNPEFGTDADFKQLVQKAHSLGMKVLIDWVANHTAWDNPWIEQHPDWYTQDNTGKIISPVADWSDVADLNYENKEMRNAMVDAMKYWLENFDIDGFRCDVAMMVPVDFWDSARVELQKVKPVLMLAESGIDDPDLMKQAFDINYSWNFYHLLNDIAKQQKTAADLPKVFADEKNILPERTVRMRFTSNHDENSWSGSVLERMPDSYKIFAALTFCVPGIPLIYSGQEACLDHSLKFFDKDTIEWKQCEMADLYKKLIKFRAANTALQTATVADEINFVGTANNKVSVFYRTKGKNKVVCIFNLSPQKQRVDFDLPFGGKFTDINGKFIDFQKHNNSFDLNAWQFIIAAKE